MATSDLDMLIDMGFERERADLAVKKTGNLQGAIDWLEQHQEKSLDEIKAGEASSAAGATADESQSEAQARSLVCNECGKKFRDTAQAEFHASKTEHTDFSESVDEIKPLTEEEKNAKLDELRTRLAARRSGASEQEKEDKKQNEKIRRKATVESQDIRENLQRKEQIKEAAKRRAEKKADDEARRLALDRIEADKQARRERAENHKAQRAGLPQPAPSEPIPAAAPAAAKPATAYTEARLRLQTSTGNFQKTFPAETTLFEVAHALAADHGVEVASFVQNFPKKVFDTTDFGQTLREAGMVPSAALIVK